MDDRERPLSKRGERDARRMGRRLRGEELVPGLTLASPAVRARETAHLAGGAGGFADRIETADGLYGAELSDCLELVRRRGGSHERVMIVGHNPGLQELVRDAGDGIEAMPTGAVAMIAVDASGWEELDPEACYLVRILVPEESG
jgi:phosphohistidine phosphatase